MGGDLVRGKLERRGWNIFDSYFLGFIDGKTSMIPNPRPLDIGVSGIPG